MSNNNPSVGQFVEESVSLDWIRLPVCTLHHQRIENEIVRCVTRISIPRRCKQKNESLGEASRRKALKRKLHILLLQ
jgi:hypothetical protein